MYLQLKHGTRLFSLFAKYQTLALYILIEHCYFLYARAVVKMIHLQHISWPYKLYEISSKQDAESCLLKTFVLLHSQKLYSCVQRRGIEDSSK